jgi:hypothetical protein
MNEHLSPEDISRWLAGERSSELERHIGECEECSARLDSMESALAGFRNSAHDWSAAQSASAPPLAWRPPVRRVAQRWLLAAASLLILVSSSAYWEHSRHEARAAEMARADALLEQVDTEISRAVPETMEPLVNLVTWGSGPANQGQSKVKQ